MEEQGLADGCAHLAPPAVLLGPPLRTFAKPLEVPL